MQKHVNCGAFGSVDKITCHIWKNEKDPKIVITNEISIIFDFDLNQIVVSRAVKNIQRMTLF